MQELVDAIVDALCERWGCRRIVHRSSPITTVTDNYDRLHYPPDGVARDARYTRYLGPDTLLRTHTSAMIPGVLRVLAGARVEDVLVACPGLVYRRDCIDRLHTGEPHQLDLWRLWRGRAAVETDLMDMIEAVVDAALPEAQSWRASAAVHPYTLAGRQIDVRVNEEWIEIGECGLAAHAILGEAGLDAGVTGLAMGLGLDRLLMIRKGIDDIRLLRSADPRVSAQLVDLAPYRPVSRQPPITRDLSIAVDAAVDAELIGDRVRDLLGDEHLCIEALTLLSETPHAELPRSAVERMGLGPSQKNVLLRLVIRHPDRSLSRAEANTLRDRIYLAVHAGTRSELSPNTQP